MESDRPDVHRRTVLAAMPALLAGCLGTSDEDGPTTRSTRTTGRLTTTRPTTTETPTDEPATTEHPYEPLVADPASMTADEVQARLADHDCAELADLPATCPGDDARLDVSASPTVGDLSADAVEFTIENRSDEPFEWNAYNWVLRKWDGSRWRRIAPLAIPAPIHGLPAGESHTYRIAAAESEPIDSLHAYVTEDDVAPGGLGPGVYDFSTHGYFESTPGEEFAAAAVFGFAGEAPPVRPTDAVARVERDGSELVVRADAPADRRGELVVSFVDGDPDARLLAEHVHQLRPLLDALPYAATDGVETIRYVGHADEVDVVDSYLSGVTPDDATRYGFREFVFEVSSGE